DGAGGVVRALGFAYLHGSMGAIIVGTHLFGSVDRVPGLGRVATQFAHFNYLPLVPLRSYIIIEGSEHGEEFQGKRISLNFTSVLIGYYRGWVGYVAAVTCTLG